MTVRCQMKRLIFFAGLFAILCLPLVHADQDPKRWWPFPGDREDPKLPNGKSKITEILKRDYEQNKKDAAALVELAQSVKEELDKEGQQVLSVNTLKKTDEMEKLSHRLHARLRSELQ